MSLITTQSLLAQDLKISSDNYDEDIYTVTAVPLNKGEPAPFTGALLARYQVENCIADKRLLDKCEDKLIDKPKGFKFFSYESAMVLSVGVSAGIFLAVFLNI